MRATAEKLHQALLRAFPVDQAYTRSRFECEPMPGLVSHFLVQSLENRLTGIGSLVPSEWYEVEAPVVEATREAWRQALLSTARVPVHLWSRTLEQAVRLVLEHLVRPAQTLTAFAFGTEEGHIPASLLLQRLAYFKAYGYLRTGVAEYIEQEQLTHVNRTPFLNLVTRLDRAHTSAFRADDWMEHLSPLFQLMKVAETDDAAGGLPVPLLRLFFEQKAETEILRSLRREEEEETATMDEAALYHMLTSPVVQPDSPMKAVLIPEPQSAESTADDDQETQANAVPLWMRFKRKKPKGEGTVRKLAPIIGRIGIDVDEETAEEPQPVQEEPLEASIFAPGDDLEDLLEPDAEPEESTIEFEAVELESELDVIDLEAIAKGPEEEPPVEAEPVAADEGVEYVEDATVMTEAAEPEEPVVVFEAAEADVIDLEAEEIEVVEVVGEPSGEVGAEEPEAEPLIEAEPVDEDVEDVEAIQVVDEPVEEDAPEPVVAVEAEDVEIEVDAVDEIASGEPEPDVNAPVEAEEPVFEDDSVELETVEGAERIDETIGETEEPPIVVRRPVQADEKAEPVPDSHEAYESFVAERAIGKRAPLPGDSFTNSEDGPKKLAAVVTEALKERGLANDFTRPAPKPDPSPRPEPEPVAEEYPVDFEAMGETDVEATFEEAEFEEAEFEEAGPDEPTLEEAVAASELDETEAEETEAPVTTPMTAEAIPEARPPKPSETGLKASPAPMTRAEIFKARAAGQSSASPAREAQEADPDKPKPLWMRFQREKSGDGASAPSETPPTLARLAEAKTPGVPLNETLMADRIPVDTDLDRVEETVLGRIGLKRRDWFVKQLFDGNEQDYAAVLRRLRVCPAWSQASQIIARDVFRKYNVNIYSEAAVAFTDSVEAHFRKK